LPTDSPSGAHKQQLRQQLLKLRRALPPAARAAQHDGITARILAGDLWRAARTVIAYMALPDEVATAALLDAAVAQGKTLVLPAVRAGEIVWHVAPTRDPAWFARGPFGILEPPPGAPVWHPATATTPCLWLVPGLAFDRAGHRLGRGGGYYDRALRAAQATRGTVGLAYREQLCAGVPAGALDWSVEFVATPDQLVVAALSHKIEEQA
jgi:5-formyltetrahydrofolate cyclo-ligase